ncbi:hypothetical protein [Paenibacillus dendritiformis]|uniref:hypothetical protein n=1 Tax=Paenibacillus dendritiformis TaxID=130049 RepID=UPI000DA9B402|nr:hypothetical protein [Paenibacillus dendritiformis]PZM64398.1 hypothetical protein DOE73_17335 [Paenibacillus dendritiformis]
MGGKRFNLRRDLEDIIWDGKHFIIVGTGGTVLLGSPKRLFSFNRNEQPQEHPLRQRMLLLLFRAVAGGATRQQMPGYN